MKFTKTISGGRHRGPGGTGEASPSAQIKNTYMADIISELGRMRKAVPIPWLYEAFVVPGHIHRKLVCLTHEHPTDEHGNVGHVEVIWRDSFWGDPHQDIVV